MSKRNKHRHSLLQLSDEKRKEIITLAGTGASIRQIALEVGIPRATLQRWVLGPLTAELKKIINDRKRRAAPEHQNHPAPSAVDPRELVHDHQEGDHVDQGRRVPGVAGVEEYRPDLRMGSIKTSHGVRSEGVPGDLVDIRRTWNGVLCHRCGGLIACDQRDYLFAKGEDGRYRPTCEECRREGGGPYFPWPSPRGDIMVAVPPHYHGERPRPPSYPGPDIPIVKVPPSPWSPRPSSGPGVRKYPR